MRQGYAEAPTLNPTKIGKYSVAGVLGRSASEEDYTADYAGRRVVIRLFTGEANREKVMEEARKIAGLNHPNIALQEVGIHEDQPFLMSELVGKSLEAWSSDEQALVDQMAVIEGIALALAHAHAQGVVHRSLSPAAIQVSAEGQAKVWHFGVGPLPPEGAAAPYVAPELLEGQASAQSDIYSAGLLFYWMLTGKGPTPGGAPAKPVRDLRPEVPKEVSEAIMACREAAPDWRPKDLGYLIEVVRKVRGPGAPRMPRPTPAARAPQAPRFGTPAPTRSGPPMALIAGAVVLIAAGAGWFFLRDRTPAPTRVAPTTTTLPAAPTTTAAPAALGSPSPEPSATPAVKTSPTPSATPSATAPPTTLAPPPTTVPAVTRPTPTPTPPPTTTTLPPAPPTTLPPPSTTAAAPVAAGPVAAGPALLKTLSPPTLRRGARQLVDVRGSGLTPNHNPTLLKGKAIPAGLTVTGARFVNEGLVQVFIQVDAAVVPGAYVLVLTDGEGHQTNPLRFDVK